MSTKKNTFARKALASVGAAALGLMGVIGLSATAMADEVPTAPDQPGAPSVGSLTLYKHVEDNASEDGKPAGDPVEGVTFQVCEVLYDTESIDLRTAEGWQLAAPFAGATPTGLPDGYELSTTCKSGVTNTDGMVKFDPLGLHLYYVTETASGSNIVTTKAAPFYVTVPLPTTVDGVTTWAYNVVAYPKNVLGDVTLTKVAGTPGTPVSHVVGSTVPWTITVPVPEADLPYIQFELSDTVGEGHTFTSWDSVSIGDTPLTAGTDYTVDSNKITLTAEGLEILNKAGAVNVTAKLTTTTTGIGILTNTADVEVNGQTAEDSDSSNWAKLVVTKVDSKSAAALAGAVFELYESKDANATHIGFGTTGPDGKLTFVVWVGNGDDVDRTVYLKETVAPNGYILPSDPWFGPFKLTAGATVDASTSTTTVSNTLAEGPDLPLTGASGTMLMTVGGIALVAVAGGLFMVTRRKADQK